MDTLKNTSIKLYKADERGFANHGWLQAAHSFSFANYYDPEKIQFGALRVLNDDIIAPGMGFGTHPHDNMEIITIPLSGVLKHRDSMHNEWQQVLPGEVQVMSAGTGVQHSEINGSNKEYLSLFQIWIIPNKRGVSPRYGQKSFSPENRKEKLQVLVSSMDDPIEGSLQIHQDAKISRIDLGNGKELKYEIQGSSHGVYAMVIDGSAKIADQPLNSRDAIGVQNAESFTVKSLEDSSFLFIEVPMH
ncbi:MAG: pirin family protein [Flavobacteriaceae bacterium]|nr:pirin family protein [Flavobacteriaceae bacterium]